MQIMDIKTTPLEVDRKVWVFSNGNSVPFSAIEQDIRERMKNVNINIYGQYDPKYPEIEPIVYLQVDYEGYHFRTMLDKRLFKEYCENINDYFEYLTGNIAIRFGRKFFLKDSEKE